MLLLCSRKQHKVYKADFRIIYMKNQKGRVGKKRRELSTIVRQTIRKEGKDRFRLEWDKMLEGQLLVGYITLKNDGNVMSLYTLNDRTAQYQDLASFNSVDIVMNDPYEGPINRLSRNEKYKGLAESISKNLNGHGYNSRIKRFREEKLEAQ